MSESSSPASSSVWRTPLFPAPPTDVLDRLDALYRDLHAHPELSMQETHTSGIVAAWLAELGCTVTTGVGGTGVVGILANGEGGTVMLRADMDALPMQETTGLDYASRAEGTDPSGRTGFVAHSCGHDMHIAWLLGGAWLLAHHRDRWRGTVLFVFQPGEETGEGAAAMIADGMLDRFPRPDVVLGQHVIPAPAGSAAWTAGTAMSASDSLEVHLHGRGAHGSSPENSIDPVVMAASAIMNLQTLRSRETGMRQSAVLTVGSVQAGNSDNVIPDEAVLKLNVRTFDEDVRRRLLSGIRRVISATAAGAGAVAEPDVIDLGAHPLTVNDPAATARVAAALRTVLDPDAVIESPPATASEDFGAFGTAWHVPSVFWFVGGTDPGTFAAAEAAGTVPELPSNHSPAFAPVIHPTLEIGMQTMLTAASAWLGDGS